MTTPREARELQAFLTREERAELDALAARDEKLVLWRPLPGPQSMAFHSTADVIGYGGAAGGGKTDLGIGKALMHHQRVGIFRREGTELSAMIDRIGDVLREPLKLNQFRTARVDASAWRGRYWPMQFEFGSTPNAGDERKYRGRPKDLLWLDEAAEFVEIQPRFLMGWVRSTNPHQKLKQTLFTFNPPTRAECRWIVAYFAPWLDPTHPAPAMPGELRWFARLPGGSEDIEVFTEEPFLYKGELVRPHSRTFIPARLADNPYLMDTNYMSVIQAMPEPLRSQMLYGDFSAGSEDDAFQVIPRAWVKAAMARWHRPHQLPPMDSMGVDVARGRYDQAQDSATLRKPDKTTIARRHGKWFDEPLCYSGEVTPNGPAVAGLVLMHRRDRAPIHIDVIGVGTSPYDFIVSQGQQAVPVIASAKAPDVAFDKSGTLSFADYRSYLWWMMREALDPANNQGYALPPDAQLEEELCMPRWEPKGRTIKVESRDELLDPKRLGRSPDVASAYIMALMDTPRMSDLVVGRTGNRAHPRDYDPTDTDR